jgi:hypothetical protein
MKITSVALLFATSLSAQTFVTSPGASAQGTLLISDGSNIVTYEPAKSSLKLFKEATLGSFTIRPIRDEEHSFVVTVLSKDELPNHGIITVFYRMSLRQKDSDKPISLLLSKTLTIPLVPKMTVMSDPFHIPWESVEFIRVVAAKEVERKDFR